MDKTFKGFAVYKRGRKLGKVTFTTYEQARSFARKHIRNVYTLKNSHFELHNLCKVYCIHLLTFRQLLQSVYKRNMDRLCLVQLKTNQFQYFR